MADAALPRPAAQAQPWRALRISFILSSLKLSGGVEAIVAYANGLSARGHRVSLVIPGGTADADVAALLAEQVTIIESSHAFGGRRNVFTNVRLAASLANAVPPSDIVIATHTPTTLSSLIAVHLLRRGRGVWLFMDYAQMFAGRAAEGWLLRNALRWHALALTISRATADELAQHARGKIRVVGLGIAHLAQLAPVDFAGRPQQPPVLFHLGDNRPRKGLADFLDAAERVRRVRPDVQIVVASKEPCALESLPYVTFHLKPSSAQLAAFYQSCTMLVSASWAEGLGYPPLEAMACATPVVMTETGGSRDYAVDGENCLLVPPRRPDLLAQAILRLLDDPALAARLAAAGPPTAARFDWEIVTDRLEGALLEVAEAPRT